MVIAIRCLATGNSWWCINVSPDASCDALDNQLSINCKLSETLKPYELVMKRRRQNDSKHLKSKKLEKNVVAQDPVKYPEIVVHRCSSK